jgi:hypothetical protein
MAVHINTRIETILSTYHEQNFGLSAEWHFFTSHGKEPADRMGGTVKRLAAKKSLPKVYNNQIQTLMNHSITAAAHSFMSRKNKFVTIRRKFQTDLSTQLQYQELKLIIPLIH